jgi:multicomponent Na+:H+ antiporter subunit A
MWMIVAILSGFALALIAPWVTRLAGGFAGRLLALLPIGLVVYFIHCADVFATTGEPVRVLEPWVPSLGLSLSFNADGLGILFALLISGVGALVLVYASGYLKGHPELGRFYAFLLAFMASMLGLVLAGNVLTLFVFWELTSLTSFFLIGFDHDRAPARSAALQALLVTGGGGLALLAGLLLLGLAASNFVLSPQSFELEFLLQQSGVIQGHELYLPILILDSAGSLHQVRTVSISFLAAGGHASTHAR